MKRFLHTLLLLLSVHTVGLFILTLFRLVLFITLHHQITNPVRKDILMQSIAFIRGIWFDNVIACYLLLVPLVILLFMGLFNSYKKRMFVFLSDPFIHTGAASAANTLLRTNGYDEIYAQENYPSEKVVNSFGVQDDFLYQYALPVLHQQAAKGTPFFASLLSISNHPSYVIPKGFHSHFRLNVLVSSTRQTI